MRRKSVADHRATRMLVVARMLTGPRIQSRLISEFVAYTLAVGPNPQQEVSASRRRLKGAQESSVERRAATRLQSLQGQTTLLGAI